MTREGVDGGSMSNQVKSCQSQLITAVKQRLLAISDLLGHSFPHCYRVSMTER